MLPGGLCLHWAHPWRGADTVALLRPQQGRHCSSDRSSHNRVLGFHIPEGTLHSILASVPHIRTSGDTSGV